MIKVKDEDILNAEKIVAKQEERIINFCDTKKLQKQINLLKNEMLKNYSFNTEMFLYSRNYISKPPLPFFCLFGLECGTGKTQSVVNNTAEFFEFDYSSASLYKGILFVMQKIETMQLYKEKINYLFSDNIAEVIDSSLSNEDIEEKIKTFPIIFISHQMYKELAKNVEKRKKFSNQRKLLIIDEFINICEIVQIDKIKLEKLRADLKYVNIQEKFDKAIIELSNFFKDLQTNAQDNSKNLHVVNLKTKYNKIIKKINEIKEDVKNTFSNNEKSKFYNENKKSIYTALDEIADFFNGTSILENGILYSPRRSIDYWFLEKNIMLDASARLNSVYKLRKKQFKDMLEKDFQVLNHKNWTIELIEFNTTTTAKNKYEDFYYFCDEILKNLGITETLIVTQKSECKNCEEEIINRTYFQNSLGSNKYEHLKNVLIAHTFNLQEKHYILEYLYYSKKNFFSDEDIKVKTIAKRRRFVNEKIEEYKERRIANEFYQAIKRVNRDMSKETRAVIITKDVEAVKLVCKMSKNCKFINSTNKYKINIKYNKEESTSDSSSRKDYDIKTITIFNAILNNDKENIPPQIRDNLIYQNNIIKLKKKILRNELNINSASNFKRNVLDNARVKQFILENEIIVEGQNIIIKSKT